MPTPAEQVAAIETTLAQLYTKLHRVLTQKDRSAVLQDISTLEKSRDYWVKEQAATAGTTFRRCSDINLGSF
jgi:hypothetical protein